MTVETFPGRDPFDDELAAMFRAAEPPAFDPGFHDALERRIAARARARTLSLSAAAIAGAGVCATSFAGFAGGVVDLGGVASVNAAALVLGLSGLAVVAAVQPLSRSV